MNIPEYLKRIVTDYPVRNGARHECPKLVEFKRSLGKLIHVAHSIVLKAFPVKEGLEQVFLATRLISVLMIYSIL